MKKIFYTMAVAAALFAGYSAYNSQNSNELTDIALANVEALAGSNESGSTSCPGPYDVRDHQLSFTKRTGNFTVDANLEITILGKKFKIDGVEAGVNITKSYEIGNCDKESPGNCCPNARNGEIKLVD